jgi:hypothetical protein
MGAGKKKGVAMIFISMAVLTVAILAFITLNTWGKLFADYINTVSLASLSTEAQVAAGTIFAAYKIFFGGLMSQVGGYMQVVGNFVGILLTCVSLGIFTLGIRTIKKN